MQRESDLLHIAQNEIRILDLWLKLSKSNVLDFGTGFKATTKSKTGFWCDSNTQGQSPKENLYFGSRHHTVLLADYVLIYSNYDVFALWYIMFTGCHNTVEYNQQT